MKFAFTFILSAVLALQALAQCSNGSCGAPSSFRFVQPQFAPVAAPQLPPDGVIPDPNIQAPRGSHGWYAGDLPNTVELHWKGERVGVLHPTTGEWRTAGKLRSVNLCEEFKLRKPGPILHEGVTLAKPSKECLCKEGECKCEKCPNDCVAAAVVKANPDGCFCQGGCKCATACPGACKEFGMTWQATPGRESYKVNGQEIGKEQLFHSLVGADVPDDSKLMRLSVIGAADKRTQVLKDLDAAPELSAFKGKYVAQGYDPAHWHVKDAGFKTTGSPTIYLQSPEGKVLHRQDDYAGGPARLASAIRKADPLYDPSKDPDLSKPKPAPTPNLPGGSNEYATVALLCLGAAGGVHVLSKKKS